MEGGTWIMHCHLDVHIGWGLATVFIVEDGPVPLQPKVQVRWQNLVQVPHHLKLHIPRDNNSSSSVHSNLPASLAMPHLQYFFHQTSLQQDLILNRWNSLQTTEVAEVRSPVPRWSHGVDWSSPAALRRRSGPPLLRFSIAFTVP